MSESVKFYLDEHVHPAVASGLRQRGIDVLTTKEADMLSATDEAHVDLALKQGRTIFTQDADFLRLHAKGKQHAGIVYAHQTTPVGHIVRNLILIFQVMTPEEMQNHVEFL